MRGNLQEGWSWMIKASRLETKTKCPFKPKKERSECSHKGDLIFELRFCSTGKWDLLFCLPSLQSSLWMNFEDPTRSPHLHPCPLQFSCSLEKPFPQANAFLLQLSTFQKFLSLYELATLLMTLFPENLFEKAMAFLQQKGWTGIVCLYLQEVRLTYRWKELGV